MNIDCPDFYADLGWQIVILHGIRNGACTCRKGARCESPGKHPRLRDWPASASSDIDVLRELWNRWPHSNLGVQLGPSSGIVDVEFDDVEGQATADEMLSGIRTTAFRSARSVHRLFHYPEGLSGKNVVSASGLEIRLGINGGSQSVFPPSNHATGIRYEWLDGLSPNDCDVAPMPQSLLDLILQPQSALPYGRTNLPAIQSGIVDSRVNEDHDRDSNDEFLLTLVRSNMDATNPK